MPLDRQIIQTSMKMGLDEGTDPRAVPFGTLTRCENRRWDKSARLAKRFGVNALTTAIQGGGNISSAEAIFARDNELCLISNGSLFSYGSDTWTRQGAVPSIGVTTANLLDTVNGVYSSDVALLSNGRIVTSWVSQADSAISQSVFFQVQNEDGSIYTAPTRIATAATTFSNVRVIANGNVFGIVYGVRSTLGIAWFYPGSGSQTIITDCVNGSGSGLAGTGPVFDAKLINGNVVIAYERTSDIRTTSYAFAASLGSPISANSTASSSDVIASISIDGFGTERIWVAWIHVNAAGSLASARYSVLNATTLAETSAPVTLTTLNYGIGDQSGRGMNIGILRCSGPLADRAIVAWSWSAPTSTSVAFDGVTQVCRVNVGGGASELRTIYGVYLWSRPFYLANDATSEDKIYLGVYDANVRANDAAASFVSLPANAYIVRIDALSKNFFYDAKLETLIAGPVYGFSGATLAEFYPKLIAANVPQSSTGGILGTLYRASSGQLTGSQGIQYRYGVRLITFSVGSARPTDMYRSAVAQREAYLACGVLQAYDGRRPFDYGMAHIPVMTGAAQGNGQSTSGGTILKGTYGYSIVAEYRSYQGVLHRGPPSILEPVVMQGGTDGPPPTGFNSFTIRVAPRSIGAKVLADTTITEPSRILHAVYRTQRNLSTLYRLTKDPSYSMISSVESAPSTDATYNFFADTLGDAEANLGFAPVIYSQVTASGAVAGDLPDFSPPALHTIILHQNRLYGVSADKRTIWFSKDWSANAGVAPGFNPQLVFVAPKDITALASMDDKLIVFFDDGIAYVAGQGPSSNGIGSDFTPLTAIASDVGCINPRSIVGSADGVFFQSAPGLMLLTRALEVFFVGKPVKDVVDAFPRITSANIVPKAHEIRFTANNALGTASCAVVFNLLERQWSTNTYAGVTSIVGACVHNDEWCFVSGNGVVYREDQSTALDNGQFVPSVIETAWFSSSGPLSFSSVRSFQFSGQSSSAHNLTVDVAFNNATSYQQSRTFSAPSEVTSVGVSQAEITIGTRRKCQNIRFRLSDAFPSVGSLGSGFGNTFDTIGVEVALKRSTPNNPATRKG